MPASEQVVDEYVAIRASDLQEWTNRLDRMVRDAKPVSNEGNAHECGLQHLYGLQDINAAIKVAVDSAEQEILTAQPYGPRPVSVLTAALEVVRIKVRGGVSMRTLYLHANRFDEATKAYVRSVMHYGVQVRTLSEFFDRLIIIDQRLAFMSDIADRTHAVQMTDRAVVRFLVDVFERTWDRAESVPFTPTIAAKAASEVVPEIHRSIQRLLMEGHSDAKIARRLGISPRALQSHIARIKENLGARNRLHLGFLLGQATHNASKDHVMSAPDSRVHAVLHTPLTGPWPEGFEVAIFGMGCFWSAERLFWKQPGVYSTAAGFAKDAEVVQVVFDPDSISYADLLTLFWKNHDPAQVNRESSVYRSAIYTTTAEQLTDALATAAAKGENTTEITPLDTFHYADDDDQQYLAR